VKSRCSMFLLRDDRSVQRFVGGDGVLERPGVAASPVLGEHDRCLNGESVGQRGLLKRELR
jgi:hypothetical protein